MRRRQVIAVAEHIAPLRPDGLIQTPNIVDDMGELRRLFAYLSEKDVWHATGSEIASYVIARERSLIHDVTRDGFSIRYDAQVKLPRLTLRVDSAAVCTPPQPVIDVVRPDGAIVEDAAYRFDRQHYRHLVTIPVMDGRYRVRPRTEVITHAA